MSFPFFDQKFEFRQPDGTTFTVRGWGDQFNARFETLDGYTVVADDQGYYCYAEQPSGRHDLIASKTRVGQRDPSTLGIDKHLEAIAPRPGTGMLLSRGPAAPQRRCDIRRMRKKQAMRSALLGDGPVSAPPSTATVGRYIGLCVLIDFSDEPQTISRQQVDDFCNKTGYNEFGNRGSVREYFLDNSKERLDYTVKVADYYRAKHTKAYYTDETIPDGVRARELVTEALEALKQRGFGFGELTADDEDYIYAINVFYAGHRQNNWSKGLWPHSWHLGQALWLAPGRKAFDYQITDMGDELALATFCHENGHMICDFPDLYDYDRYQVGYGVGRYCLMCNSGPNRTNPCQVSAYLKFKAGWADSTVPITPGLQATVAADKNDFYIYSKNATEYFLLENRQQQKRDEDLPSSGLAIWHVDELGNNNHEMMTEAKHYECSLEQADGRFDLERRRNPGDATDLFSDSTTNRFLDREHVEYNGPLATWWDGTPSGLALYDIGPSGPQMSFRAEVFGQGGGEKKTWSSSPAVAIPDADHNGVTDVIDVTESLQLTALEVRVEIDHTYRGDLRVTLMSPLGREVVLHERTGGSADHLKRTFRSADNQGLMTLIGENTKGTWRLWVQDLAARDEGTLKAWSLTCEGTAAGVVDLSESPGQHIPDESPAGITRTLTASGSGKVDVVSVGVDLTHTWIGDLRVELVSPKLTSILLHNFSGGSTDNLVKTYDASNTPELAKLQGEPVAGDWQLKVSDHVGHDTGKLNSWGVKIRTV